jgi:hypothetical protein
MIEIWHGPTLIEEYGLEAADRWVRVDLGVLVMTPTEASEACRKLTRTMLSVRSLREGEQEKNGYDFTCEILPAGTVALIDRLARDEDRSITWPGYPDPKERLKILGRAP